MAINKNHTDEEINGVKCAVVEKNITAERATFLKELLELNDFTVQVGESAPPKVAAAPPKPLAEGEVAPPPPPLPPVTFTVGVTNLAFNSINAVFGRLLRTKDGKVVTLNYWQQKEEISRENIPYFSKQ